MVIGLIYSYYTRSNDLLAVAKTQSVALGFTTQLAMSQKLVRRYGRFTLLLSVSILGYA